MIVSRSGTVCGVRKRPRVYFKDVQNDRGALMFGQVIDLIVEFGWCSLGVGVVWTFSYSKKVYICI